VSVRSSLALLRVPSFGPALLALLFAVLSEAVAGSYLALLAVQKVGMSPLELSAFLTVSAISGIGITTWFGHMHDRKPVMWPLLASLVAKVIGYGLSGFLTETWMLLVNAFVLFGLASSSQALLFAIARGYLDRIGGDVVHRGMASLRMTISLSWAIGPAVGAALVAFLDFEGVFAGAAALAVMALAIVLVSRIKVTPNLVPDPTVINLDVVRAAAPAVLALTAFHWVMLMGSNATSIIVVQELGTSTDVGLIYSLCALLEVFVMGYFVVRPVDGNNRGLLLFGFVVYAAHFVLMIVVPTLWVFYAGQALRALAIGIISIVGMAHIQALLPGRAGVAAALFANTMIAGSLLSGLGTGLWAEVYGYWSIFTVSTVLCLAGGAVLFWPATSAQRQLNRSRNQA
jgi:SET family sugar efflux transporter-like MFS transporter